jgi:hypothetical protein
MVLPLAGSATGLSCSAEMTRSVRPALYAGSVVYPWPRNRKPRHSLQEEPRSILGCHSADDACEHLYILTIRSSLGPSPPHAGRYTVASRFRCRSCERGYIFPRAPEQFVASPLCLVGYVRWDERSDRVPPLQTITFSSFTGRTPANRPRSVEWRHEVSCVDGGKEGRELGPGAVVPGRLTWLCGLHLPGVRTLHDV